MAAATRGCWWPYPIHSLDTASLGPLIRRMPCKYVGFLVFTVFVLKRLLRIRTAFIKAPKEKVEKTQSILMIGAAKEHPLLYSGFRPGLGLGVNLAAFLVYGVRSVKTLLREASACRLNHELGCLLPTIGFKKLGPEHPKEKRAAGRTSGALMSETIKS